MKIEIKIAWNAERSRKDEFGMKLNNLRLEYPDVIEHIERVWTVRTDINEEEEDVDVPVPV